MRFWLFIFVLIIGMWGYYLIKPYLHSSASKVADLVRKNLRKELKGTKWQMEDGRVGAFVDVEDGGRIFVLLMADGSKVKVSYQKLTRYNPEQAPTGGDDITEIR